MKNQTVRPALPLFEFVAMMAMMMSLIALSIDSMLPALPMIGLELGVQNPNDNQLIVSVLFLGMVFGQLIYGPLSDSIGRKPTIVYGISIYAIGCAVSYFSSTFPIFLLGRLIQGIGVASLRVVIMALVRDVFEGREMARVMSFIMTVVILVPAVAPLIGQGILLVAHWRMIFAAFLIPAILVLSWFLIRQPETLSKDRRSPFSFRTIGKAMLEVCTNRVSLGYTLAAGAIHGAFIAYVSSAQQIFQGQYQLGSEFPFYFGVLALSIGCAAFFNGKLVRRFGAHPMANVAVMMFSGTSIGFFAIALTYAGNPPFWMLMSYFVVLLFCMGLLLGNVNALAMKPLGHIAGIGASVVGFLSTIVSVCLGVLIGTRYDGTILPLVAGISILGLGAYVVMRWSHKS